jgi:hypothetical protein
MYVETRWIFAQYPSFCCVCRGRVGVKAPCLYNYPSRSLYCQKCGIDKETTLRRLQSRKTVRKAFPKLTEKIRLN